MYQIKVRETMRKYYSVWMPLLFYVLFCGVKMLVLLPMVAGPMSYGDEWLYKSYAYQWFMYGEQFGTHYPPGYPLALMPAFLFDNWYKAIIVLNILYSSVVVVLVYFIGRLYFDEKNSTLLMVLAALNISQFVFPTMCFSENLYMPLFFLVVYLVLKPDGEEGQDGLSYSKVVTDLLLGFFIAFLCLTRYISLVTIPVFALVWLMKQLDNKVKWKWIILRGCSIVVCLVLTYLPWYLMNRGEVPFKEIIGFGIASDSNPDQLTVSRLIMVLGFYLAYFVLLAAPVILELFYSLGCFAVKKPFCNYNRLWVTVYGLTGAFLVAVVRHSWKAAYNFPEFKRIMGRYLIYFPLLYLILAFATRKKVGKKPAVLTVLLAFIGFGAVAVSYGVEIIEAFGNLAGGFLNWRGSVDGVLVQFKGEYYLVGIALILAVSAVLFISKNKKVLHCSAVAMIVLLVAYQLWGMPKYYDRFQENYRNGGMQARRIMNEVAAHTEITPDSRIYYHLSDEIDTEWEKRYITFFGNKDELIVTDQERLPMGGSYYVVCDEETIKAYDAYDTEEICRIERKDVVNILLHVSGEEDESDEKKVTDMNGLLFMQKNTADRSRYLTVGNCKIRRESNTARKDADINSHLINGQSKLLKKYTDYIFSGNYLKDTGRIVPESLKHIPGYNMLKYLGCRYVVYRNSETAQEVAVNSEAYTYPVEVAGEFVEGEEVCQEFVAEENNMNSVAVRLATYGKDLTNSNATLKVCLAEKETGVNIATKEVKFPDVVDDGYLSLYFEKQSASKEKSYVLSMTVSGMSDWDAITAWTYGTEAYIGELYIGGNKIENDLVIRSNYLHADMAKTVNVENNELITVELDDWAERVSLAEEVVVDSEEGIIQKMQSQYRDNLLFLEQSESNKMPEVKKLGKDERAEILFYKKDKIVIRVNTSEPRYLMLNEYYDKNWNVYVDGKKQKNVKGNLMFSAVWLEEAGEHEVEFRYEPKFVFLIYGGALSVGFGLVLVGVLLNRRRSKKSV